MTGRRQMNEGPAPMADPAGDSAPADNLRAGSPQWTAPLPQFLATAARPTGGFLSCPAPGPAPGPPPPNLPPIPSVQLYRGSALPHPCAAPRTARPSPPTARTPGAAADTPAKRLLDAMEAKGQVPRPYPGINRG